MPKKSRTTDRPRARGPAGTTFDLTVGGAVLAADKAADAIDAALEKGSEVVGDAREVIRHAKDSLVGSMDDAGSSSYESRTKDDLYRLAQAREIDGRSHMTKEELIEALRAS